MEKIYRVQRTQVMIHCGFLISLILLFWVMPIGVSFLPNLSVGDRGEWREWVFTALIILMFANIALSMSWRHVTRKRCRAVVDEFNGQCK